MSKVGHTLQRLRKRSVSATIAMHPIESTSAPCMNCGKSKASMIMTSLYFDFDPESMPPHLREVFMTREDGICVNCGLYQDFRRFTQNEMKAFLDFNKDETVSEGGFHAYPLPEKLITDFYEARVERRIQQWDTAIGSTPHSSLNTCLFLRPMFGGTLSYIKSHFGPEIHALEISASCRRYISDHFPEVHFPKGQIHGIFELEDAVQTGYDAIFVFHSLLHSIDVHRYLDNLVEILSPNGFIIFSQETQSKPQNPFHTVFPSERILVQILQAHFSRINRIPDCEPDPPLSISSMTEMGDSPDFVCRL